MEAKTIFFEIFGAEGRQAFSRPPAFTHLHTTNQLRFIKRFLHIFNESTKKHKLAALDGAAPYLITEQFLPPPWNHVTHGVQNLDFAK